MIANKYIFPAISFGSGLTMGIILIGLMSFKPAPSSAGGTQPAPVSVQEAHNYFNQYMAGATAYNQVMKGFTIDRAQLDAMNMISRENPELSGFRIYMGKDNTSAKLGIVVGIDNMGKDAVKNTIFSTAAQNLSPCPPICDVSSPIVNN